MKEEQTTKNPAENSAEAASGSATGRRRRSRGRSRGHQNGQNAQQASAQSAGSASQKSQQNAGQRAQQNNVRQNRPGRGAAVNRKPGNPAGRNSAGGRSWGDYMRQLLVVIVGVALTLAAAGLVERWREARQVRGVMQLVSEELKANRALTAEACRGFALLDEYGRDYGRIPADTLEKYRSDVERAAGFAPQSDALEVLRASGAMAAVQDRQLLLEVLECYAYLERFGAAVNNYNSQETALGDCFGPETLEGGAVEHVDRVLRQLDERYGFGR